MRKLFGNVYWKIEWVLIFANSTAVNGLERAKCDILKGLNI